MQWGAVDNVIFNENYYPTVTFPTPFPHKCMSVMTTTDIYDRTSNGHIPGLNQSYVDSYTNTQVRFYPGFKDHSGNRGKIFWYAIGY